MSSINTLFHTNTVFVVFIHPIITGVREWNKKNLLIKLISALILEVK